MESFESYTADLGSVFGVFFSRADCCRTFFSQCSSAGYVNSITMVTARLQRLLYYWSRVSLTHTAKVFPKSQTQWELSHSHTHTHRCSVQPQQSVFDDLLQLKLDQKHRKRAAALSQHTQSAESAANQNSWCHQRDTLKVSEQLSVEI